MRNSIYRIVLWRPEFNDFKPCYTLYPILLKHEANIEKPKKSKEQQITENVSASEQLKKKKQAETPLGRLYFVRNVFQAIHALPETLEPMGFRLPENEFYRRGKGIWYSHTAMDVKGEIEYQIDTEILLPGGVPAKAKYLPEYWNKEQDHPDLYPLFYDKYLTGLKIEIENYIGGWGHVEPTENEY